MSILPGWDVWLTKYNSGICIESVSEIHSAVNKISSCYEEYMAGAKRHFFDDLVFDKFFDEFYEIINKSG